MRTYVAQAHQDDPQQAAVAELPCRYSFTMMMMTEEGRRKKEEGKRKFFICARKLYGAREEIV